MLNQLSKQFIQDSIILIKNNGIVYHRASWLLPEYATHCFNVLQQSLAWQQEKIILFGKEYCCPRLTAWHGDSGIRYTYSGVLHSAMGWHPLLLAIKNKLQQQTRLVFNSVLCNYYQHGQHAMGWHSDDENALGRDPNIASVSLGAPRAFVLRHKATKQRVKVFLTHGSLLLMTGETQHYWQHALPKTKKVIDGRINLTFRFVNNV